MQEFINIKLMVIKEKKLFRFRRYETLIFNFLFQKTLT